MPASSLPTRIFSRSLSTTSPRRTLGPEHPQYIPLPQSPQQSAPYKPFIKGVLPVPRDLSPRSVPKDLKLPERQVKHPRGSREAWQQKLSAARRENLTEGLRGVKHRAERQARHDGVKRAQAREVRREALTRPEREDERLTTPSTGLDVEKLLSGRLEDPTRETRLAYKARNLTLHTAAKRANRMDNLHTLYMHARSFIVEPGQLDKAIDEEFGTQERPRTFGGRGPFGAGSADGIWSSNVTSMWADGAPMTIQDMLARRGSVGGRGRNATAATGGLPQEVTRDRVQRVAEGLTGGRID